MIRIEDANRSISRDLDQSIFWDEMVRDVAEAWKREDVSSLHRLIYAHSDLNQSIQRSHDAFKIRAAIFTMMSADPSLNFDMFKNVAPAYTSCGDLTRLNILEPFRASAATGTIIVEDIDFSNRYTHPAWTYCFLEYDGILRIKCFTSAKHTTRVQLDECAAIAKEYFDLLFIS